MSEVETRPHRTGAGSPVQSTRPSSREARTTARRMGLERRAARRWRLEHPAPTVVTYDCVLCGVAQPFEAHLCQPPVMTALNTGWRRTNRGWQCPDHQPPATGRVWTKGQ